MHRDALFSSRTILTTAVVRQETIRSSPRYASRRSPDHVYNYRFLSREEHRWFADVEGRAAMGRGVARVPVPVLTLTRLWLWG